MQYIKTRLTRIGYMGLANLLSCFTATYALAQQPLKSAPQFNIKPSYSLQKQAPIDQKTKAQQAQILRGLQPVNDIAPSMKKLRTIFKKMATSQRAKNTDRQTFKNLMSQAKSELNQLIMTANRLDQGYDNAAQIAPTQAAKAALKKFKYQLAKINQKLEAEDKLGNVVIQDLLSSFNQAQTMATNVEKKNDDTKSAVLGKI